MIPAQCYLNGKFLPINEAKLSILDLGLVRGYGVFDYLRTYQRKPFHLYDHLQRLSFSAEQLGIPLPHSLGEIEQIIHQLIESQPKGEFQIKIILTGGYALDQITPENKPSIGILVYPYSPYPKELHQEGTRVISTDLQRYMPHVKSLQYAPAIISLKRARSRGADDALFINDKREILEATTSNFFAFKGDELLTPPLDEILSGVTRQVVLNLVQDDYTISTRTISYDEITTFDEAFLTSSSKEILPLIAIDEKPIGDGKVGKRTKKVAKLFEDYTRKGKWHALASYRHTSKELYDEIALSSP